MVSGPQVIDQSLAVVASQQRLMTPGMAFIYMLISLCLSPIYSSLHTVLMKLEH